MDPSSRAPDPPVSGSYLWEVPGKPVAIQIDLNVVDRISQEVLRGFGTVARRGVECGGLLLGTVEARERALVRIVDFEPVACQHARGPYYALTDAELARFGETVEQWRANPSRQVHAVGWYRGHLREGLGLSEEDLTHFDRWFPGLSDVALLVKPFATRPSVGAFFFRENGSVRSESSYQEFPFRRRDLGGEAVAVEEPAAELPAPPEPAPPAAPAVQPEVERGSLIRRSGNWILVPLSFIFLLLGVVLGFQVALGVRSQVPNSRTDPYTLGLSATPTSDSLHVNWDRNAPAIEQAQRGILWIQDGPHRKSVDLDLVQLQNGSIIYRRATGDVSFRLEIFARDRITISEAVSVRLDQPAPVGR
jgi:hypothetical protein